MWIIIIILAVVMLFLFVYGLSTMHETSKRTKDKIEMIKKYPNSSI